MTVLGAFTDPVMKDSLLQKVHQTIDRHQMLAFGDTVVLAVSGGVDSMVLLRLFLDLRPRYCLSLHVAHVDHGLRGTESAEAAVFVRRRCGANEVPMTLMTADGAALRGRRGGSLQEVARDLRYRFLERVADELGATKIASGHHRDDQAETVVMNLLRGSGARGLAGIPPVRGRIIRPLIDCSREEIMRYARAEEIPYVEDSSNHLLSYTRNRIRLELLPELGKRYNPHVVETLASAGAILEAEDALLSAMTEEQFWAVVISQSPTDITLSVSRLGAVPPALGRRIIRRSAQVLRGDRPGLTFQQTMALERLLRSEAVQGPVHVAGGIRATRSGDRLIFSVGVKPTRDDIRPVALEVPGEIDLPGCSLSLRCDILDSETASHLAKDRWVALLDADRAGGELVVRGWEPGDRFIPLGMTGHKKLQDFFVDAKVPRDQRWAVPLLVSYREIAWVVGFRVDERFKVTGSTRRVLRVSAARQA